ncbi:MAG TPA: hypothetical protein VLC91_12260 [Spongiibacteraceae bacterium]|nr:hypothetical protein [Spongiibacteraceae bacterium]
MIFDRAKLQRIWWLIFAAVIAHLLICRLPLINQEWAFADAARYFETHRQDFLERYFSVQANTLGVPFLAFLIHKVIASLDIGLIPRLLAVSGFIFTGLALVRLNLVAGSKIHSNILLAAVFLNPLIWTFGGRGTADFLPAAVALFSLSLFFRREKNLAELIVASLTFGIAVTLKYHAVALLPIVWAAAFARTDLTFKRALLQSVIATGLILLLPIGYLLAVKQHFGFWLAPPAFQNMHRVDFSIASLSSNFIAYMGYLALLGLPLSGLCVGQYLRNFPSAARLAIAALGLFLAGYLFVVPSAEMNFGPLDKYLGARFVGGAFTVCAGLFLVALWKGVAFYRDDRCAHRFMLCCAVGVLIFIGCLSATRPAQRYLLFVVPLFYLFILPGFKGRPRTLAVTFALYTLLNIYVALNQYATGSAAIEITEKIAQSGLLGATNPGVIVGHTGNYFPVDTTANKKYIVVAGLSPKRILSSESLPVPLIHKAFSLVPIE